VSRTNSIALHDGDGRLHRRFFIGAVGVMLTLGASWGTILLWQIARAGHFTSLSVQAVNAHGSAQVFGWVGLFVMGAAYQGLPRVWGGRLYGRGLVNLVLGLTVAGIALTTLGVGVRETVPGGNRIAVTGALLHVIAVTIFAAQILITWSRSGAAIEVFTGFVFSALFWFVGMSLLNAWHTYTTLTAVGFTDLLWYVATYQAPLRDMQIHGMALLAVLGVSVKVLPELLGVPGTGERRGWWAVAILNAAVAGECVIFVAYRWSDNHVIAAFLMLPWILLCVGVGMIAGPWRLWRKLPVADGAGAFVRAAYAWLGVSLLMLVMLPVYTRAVGLPFSHAYYGSIRHAVTVGFVSVMIMGLSLRLLPGTRGASAPRILVPLILVNCGCGLRVVSQALTDTVPGAFSVIGVSGVLELVGFTWWAVVLVRVMWSPIREGEAPAGPIAFRNRRLGGSLALPLARRGSPMRVVAAPGAGPKMDKEVRISDFARSEHV
jgi:hypothetical protein